ncbi:hypothetical protein KVP09_04400 [Alcaligenaceae bacterium CGII-47]|nr:hypothetical protein [Alcaligenaceae bacterium CGII-47]
MSEARARLDALPATYPRLFPKGPVPWGFAVSDGWGHLIETLCARLDTILQDAPGASIEVIQVKEKFGALRFYYSVHHADDSTEQALRQAVDLAARASAHICERCGRPSELTSNDGWYSTVCPACRSATSR